MNQDLSTLLAAGIPTLAVIVAVVRNEAAISGLTARVTSLDNSLSARITSLENSLSGRITSLEIRLDARITSLENRLDARIETLDHDLREWAKITMQHNSDISRA